MRFPARALSATVIVAGALAFAAAASASNVTARPTVHSDYHFRTPAGDISCRASVGARSSGVTCLRARDGRLAEVNGFTSYLGRGVAGYRGPGRRVQAGDHVTLLFQDGSRALCVGLPAAIRCVMAHNGRGFVIGTRQARRF